MRNFNDREVRWGVLGVGNVCEVKSAPAMKIIANSKLVAVMRRDEKKVRDYAQRHGVKKWYTDARKLIDDPEVNAVYIATPPDSHLELARLVAKSGKPVYVEKPMARTHAECLEMVQVCENWHVPLFVAYYRRTLPNFLKIKELVESGIIGSVRYVKIEMNQPISKVGIESEGNWRVDPRIAGGGYFYDLASHQLDFLDFLFGPILTANGFSVNQAGRYAAEDLVTGSFKFENEILGIGSWCFTSSNSAELELTSIIGSKGTIRYPTFGDPHVILETDENGIQRFEFEMPKNIQFFLIESIVKDLLGEGLCSSTGISASRTNWAMEQLTKNI